MRKRTGNLILGPGTILAMGLVALAASQALHAQQMPAAAAAKTKAAPAAPHDITGVWMGIAGSTISNVGALTPWGQEQFNANKPFNGAAKNIVPVGQSNDPFVQCDPMGFPRAVFFETRGIEFDPLPNKMLELFQYQKIWREIWMDGRALPKNAGGSELNAPDPRWYGYSIGHWDGDYTFVTETVGMDDRTWLDALGHPHSVELKVGERYRRVDHDNLEVTVTIDDPKAYVKPFTTKPWILTWNPKKELEEQMCVPSEAKAYFDVIGGPAGNTKK
jgi:hypothetical protein